MNCYILVFRPADLDRQIMLNFLNTVPEVRHWRAHLGAIFVVAEVRADVIAAKIHAQFPNLLFVLALIDGTNTQGWADPVTWEFVSNPNPGIKGETPPAALPKKTS